MHTVRVYLNRREGTTWWAEDDFGFTGGADRLSDLVDMIQEWAGCEGVLDDLVIRLVGDQAEEPAVSHFSIKSGPYDPVSVGVAGARRVATAVSAV